MHILVTFFHKGAFQFPMDEEYVNEERARLSRSFDNYEDAQEFADKLYELDFDYFILVRRLHPES